MSNTLNVPISEKTRRKLGALAILTGQKFDSMEAELAELIDGVLSVKIDEALAAIDGREPSYERSEESPTPKNTKTYTAKKPLSAGQVVSSDDIFEDIAGHSLSADADEEEPELADQAYAAMEQNLRDTPVQRRAIAPSPISEFKVPELNVADAGEDAESFLEGMDLPVANPSNALRAGVVSRRKATAASGATKPRVSVSDYSGIEDEDLF